MQTGDQRANTKEILICFSGNPQKNKSRILKFYDGAIRTKGIDFDFIIVSYNETAEESLKKIELDGIELPQKIYGPAFAKKFAYPNKIKSGNFKLKPGNCDLPILAIWMDFKQYDRYWVVEDDVDFSGDIAVLFDDLKYRGEDLIATHLYPGFKTWDYYSMFNSGPAMIPEKNLYLCFLPFFVIKSGALKAIDEAYRSGWAGHHEMTWPTILQLANKPIFDIGGCGPFVSDGYENKFYIGSPKDKFKKSGSFGTMTVRLATGKEKNKLWHPVKSFSDWLPQMSRRVKSYVGWVISNKLQSGRRAGS